MKRKVSNNNLQTMTDKYIEILEYCDKQGIFTLKQVFDSIELPDDLRAILEYRASQNSLFMNDKENPFFKSTHDDIHYFLTKDECFQLLEHRQLQEARAGSKKALIFAVAALTVSFLSFMFTIVVAFYPPPW